MAFLPAAAVAAGAGMQAVGAIYEANAKAGAAEYSAKVNEQNATYAMQQGAEDERRARIMGRKVLGGMRAGFGASGITLEGSATDALEESASNAELDALTVRHGAELKAYGYQNEARLDRYRAKTARTGGYFGAASSIISAGGKIGSM
jgi:hypothetical protein